MDRLARPDKGSSPIDVDEEPAMDAAVLESGRYRVLVVDDVEVNRLIAIDLLSRLGVEAAEARDGLEALWAVQNGLFDLILMDVQMPVMDGLAATSAIRALPTPVARIPIIAVTAGWHIDESRCAASGMNDFLAKPISIESFTVKVMKWLRPPEDRFGH